MPTVRCPECDRPVTVGRGGAVSCPTCGTRVTAEMEEPPTVVAVDESEGEEVPARPRRRRAADNEGDSRVPCPACGSRWIRKGPWPWYLGTVGLMFCKAVECEKCGHEFDLYKPHADLAKRKMNLAIAINGVGLLGIILVIGGLFVWIRMVMKQ